MRATGFFALLAITFSLGANAAVYNFDFNGVGDSGPVPQGGDRFVIEHTLSGIGTEITSFNLILTFNSGRSLSGDSSGIEGLLTLGTGESSPYVHFFPTITYSGTGSQRIYDFVFSAAPGSPGGGFNGLDPNNVWSLLLWDNGSSGLENGVVSWSLDITTVSGVPEPINVALGVFGGLFAAVAVGRRIRSRVQERARERELSDAPGNWRKRGFWS